MRQEEVERVLEELQGVRPEKLNGEAKRLFEAIMKIADERDSIKADLYEANNRINDLLDIVKQKDKIIDLMAQELIDQQVRAFKDNFDPFKYINKEQVKKYFEERCK
jgi:hypothetical protein